jgi:hypothetical protein
VQECSIVLYSFLSACNKDMWTWRTSKDLYIQEMLTLSLLVRELCAMHPLHPINVSEDKLKPGACNDVTQDKHRLTLLPAACQPWLATAMQRAWNPIGASGPT